MADKKVSALDALTVPTRDDLLYVVDAPGSSPASYNVALQVVLASGMPVVAASDSSAAAKCRADYVCDGTDDDVEIQAAIDAAATLAMGTVTLLHGAYHITSTLDLKIDTGLLMERGAVVHIDADVDGINIKGGSSIRGGFLIAPDEYTGAVIRADGSSLIRYPAYMGGAYNLATTISDLIIKGQDILGGIGIYFVADETEAPGMVAGVRVQNVGIWKLQTGIKLAALNLDTQPTNSAGGCVFRDIFLWFQEYGVYLETDLWEQVGFNTFANMMIYAAGADTIASIYCEGSHNVFAPVWLMDNVEPSKTLVFADPATTNRVSGIIGGAVFSVQYDQSNHIDDYFSADPSGTGKILSGDTAIVVTHGCLVTPTAAQLSITPMAACTNDPGHWWVDTITATTFTVRCTNDPGASGFYFGWRYNAMGR